MKRWPTRAAAIVLAVIALTGLVCSIAHAQDADTIRVDGITYRLDGIDAPEFDQLCLDHLGVAPVFQRCIAA